MTTPEVRLYRCRGPPVKAELGRTGGADSKIAPPPFGWAWLGAPAGCKPCGRGFDSLHVHPIPVYALVAFAFAQRAWTAFLAASERCSGVMAAALAWPPTLPPLRPRETAAGFLRFFLMPQ
jgi:hypothetical protein